MTITPRNVGIVSGALLDTLASEMERVVPGYSVSDVFTVLTSLLANVAVVELVEAQWGIVKRAVVESLPGQEVPS